MRADRLLSLLMLLQIKGRVTARDLAQELEVSERTIYRDIEALSTAGVPVYAERGPGGGCALVDSYRTNLTGLTESEVRALFISTVPGPLKELGLGKAVEAAMLKLSAALPATHRADVERVRQRIHVDSAQWFRTEEPVPFLPLIQDAVWQERKLYIKYRRADSLNVRRLVDPYGVIAKAGTWYLVGAMRRKTFVYRVSRITEAELSYEKFARPEGFDLPKFWEDWCSDFEANIPKYPVRLRVSPHYVPVLPMIFGEGVHAIINSAGPPDDEGWITITLTFERMEAARAQMLGLGTWAEVLDPPELRDEITRMAARVIEFYKNPAAFTHDRTTFNQPRAAYVGPWDEW